jgi:hypothetical protein
MAHEELDNIHADIAKLRAVTMRLVDEPARLLDMSRAASATGPWAAIGDWRTLVVGIGLFAAGAAIALVFIKAFH